MRTEYVYFYKHNGLSPIKIGITTNENPLQRFNEGKTYAPYGLEFLGFIETNDSRNLEKLLHSKYSDKRVCAEWFEITKENVKYEIEVHSRPDFLKEKEDFEISFAKTKIDKIIITNQYFKNEIPIMEDNIVFDYRNLYEKNIIKEKKDKIISIKQYIKLIIDFYDNNGFVATRIRNNKGRFLLINSK